jgi:hypothetical protein
MALIGITMSGAAGSVVELRFSSNGGSTYLSAATHAWMGTTVAATTGAVGGAGTTTATALHLSFGLTTSPNPYDASIEIFPGTASGIRAGIRGSGTGVNATPDWFSSNFSGTWIGTAALMNACQLFPSLGGTMSGTVILEGLP